MPPKNTIAKDTTEVFAWATFAFAIGDIICFLSPGLKPIQPQIQIFCNGIIFLAKKIFDRYMK